MAIYTNAKALSRWPINDESTLTGPNVQYYLFMHTYLPDSLPTVTVRIE
jgi:hypothetical protein